MAGTEILAWIYEWKPFENNNPWEVSVSLKDPRVGYPIRMYRNVRPLALAVDPNLCEDEGCDHFGTKHVCISTS